MINKKIFLVIGLSLLALVKLSGQGLLCETSEPFCTGSIYTFPAGTTGTAQYGAYYGCLNTQPAPAWYHMLIDDPGQITIYMYSTPLVDIDFICWGPFTDPYAPCVQGLTVNTVVDCSYSTAPTEYCDIPNGQTGQYYILLITNYSQQPCEITFSQTAGNGSTDCTILPPPVGNNGPLCVGETLNLYAETVVNASYWWSGPNGYLSSQQNPVIPNVSTVNAGDYSCVITVNGQSSDPAITSVIIYSLPTAALLSGDTTVCPENPAYAIMHFTGWGPYKVYYTNGLNNLVATNLSGPVDTIFLYPTGPTTYTFTKVEDIHCERSLLFMNLDADTYPATSGTLSGSTTICDGESALLTFNLTGTPPWNITYTANGGNPQVVAADLSPYLMTVNPATTTTYAFTYLEDINCTGETTGQAVVTVNPSPTTDAGTDQSIPYGTTTVLNGQVSGGSGDYQYAWEPAGKLTNPGIQQPTTVNLTESTLFTLTATDNQGGCYDADDILVTITGGALGCFPEANPSSICPGETSQLVSLASGGSGTYTYSWSSNPAGFSSTLPEPVVNPTQTTIYTVIVNDGFNVNSGDVTVNVYQQPVPEAGNDITIPHGINTVLQGSASGGSGSYAYHWEPANKLVDPDVAHPQTLNLYATTLFTLDVTDLTFGCQAAVPDQMTVIISGNALAANPSVLPGEICHGGSAQLFAIPSGGAGAGTYTYSWSSNPPGFSSTFPDPVVTPTQTTTYTVLVNDGYNVTNGIATLIVYQLPIPDAGNDITIPHGTTTVLNGQVSGGSGDYQYAWEPADKLVDPTIQQPTTVNLTTTTLFTLTVTDNVGGCYDSDDMLVTISGGPLGCFPAAQPSAICAGETSLLRSLASGGSGDYTFLWSSNPAGFNSSLPEPVVNPTQTTTYTVLVNDGYNVISGNVTLTVHQLPVPEAGNDITIPHGTNTVLEGSATSGSGSYVYHWEPADKLVDPDVAHPQTLNLFSSTLFTLDVIDLYYGCHAAITDQMTVIISGTALAVNPAVSQDEICLGGSAQLFAVPGGGAGPENYTFSWHATNGYSSTVQDPWITPLSVGSFVYTCTVNDGFNSTQGSVTIDVLALPYIDFGFSDTTICVYDTVVLDAGNFGSEYVWSNGSTEKTIQVATTGIGFDMQTHSVAVTNQSGCRSELSVNIVFDFSACTGIGDDETGQFCRIYPNPGNGTLHLFFQSGIKDAVVSASNLLGQNAWGPYQFNDIGENGEVILNMGRKPEGVYFIHIKNEDSVSYTFKYILRR